MQHRLTINGSVAGVTFPFTLIRESDGGVQREVALPAGQTGVLTTRTDDNTGTITMDSASHGITTGMRVAIFFASGVQRKVTVGTVSGTSVPIDLGIGANLPAQGSAVVVAPEIEIDLPFSGDDMAAIAAFCVNRSNFGLFNGATEHLNLELPAGEGWFWVNGQSAPNPIAGDTIASAYAANGGVAAATFKIGIGIDATP